MGPLPGSWLAACMTKLTPDLQICLLCTLQSLSVSGFHVVLGLPGPCFPSTWMSQAALTALLENSTCPYQRSILSFRMRSRFSVPSCASSSLDQMVTMSCVLTFQICLSIALSFRCRRWRFGFVNDQVSMAWSIALRTQERYTRPCILKEMWLEEKNGSSSLNFFQAVSHVLWLKVQSHWQLRACLLCSKRKLLPPACQVRLGLPFMVCHPMGMQFPGMLYSCIRSFVKRLSPLHLLCSQCLQP